MKNNILYLADLHAHPYKNNSKIIDGTNSRLLDLSKVFLEALEVGKKYNCGTLIIAGDVFHVRGSIKPSVLNMIDGLINVAVNEYSMDVRILAGNHDYETFDGEETAISILSNIKNVDAYSETHNEEVCGKKFSFIPYIHSVDDFKEEYRRVLKAENPDVFVIHQGVDDVAPSDDIPRTGITAEFLTKGFDGWVFTGHYHKPSKPSDSRVVNIGAPYQLTFGDEGARGCWIFNPEEKGSVFFHELTKAPKFLTIDYRELKVTKDMLPVMSGNFVRLITSATSVVDGFVENLKEAGAASVVIHLEKEFSSAHEKTIKLSSPSTMFSNYIDINEKYQPHKARLLRLFGEICL